MSTFTKCEICDAEISGVKCMFATYKRVIDGKEHYFCCESHANEYERSRRGQRSRESNRKNRSSQS